LQSKISGAGSLIWSVRLQRPDVGATMDKTDFAPMQYPIPWPPPDLPSFPPHPLSRIPVLGWPFRYFRWLRYSSQHQRVVLDPIAENIVAQLEKRPTDSPWPICADQKVLAKIISDAVAFEKGLPVSPALHQDDPFPLLFWGPFDDITPLIVRVECRKKLNREIPSRLLIDAWNERWSVGRFIEECTRLDPE
tara:strand:+ start:2717 stop:3292 length:576 start_codon:yes stop_codon:yes gene_type:complete